MRDVFSSNMAQLRSSLTGPVTVNGDGRFDTPGHSATYGAYTMMDAKTSKILVSNLVKVWHGFTSCILYLFIVHKLMLVISQLAESYRRFTYRTKPRAHVRICTYVRTYQHNLRVSFLSSFRVLKPPHLLLWS